MFKANLILILNETLKKAEEKLDTKFICVKYALLGAKSALLIEKANTSLLVSQLSNLCICIVKTINSTEIRVEI